MDITVAFSVYISTLAFAFAGSIINKKFLHSADKHIRYLLLTTILAELTAYYFMDRYKNNMFVYHIFSPIELFLIALYFQSRVEWLQRRKVGFYIGYIGIAGAICNIIFWQSINTINSIFLLFEGFTIIGLCVFSYYQLMFYQQPIVPNVHFWITTLFLTYWSCVFSYWGMYNVFLKEMSTYVKPLTYSLWAVNILT